MSRIINTNIRLNLDNEDDKRAWERLQQMDRTRYKSYSRAVVAALNDFFDRQERLVHDPYLETREKEDAFLKRVLDTVERGLHSTVLSLSPTSQADSVEPPPGNVGDSVNISQPSDDTEQEDMENTLMDFIENF